MTAPPDGFELFSVEWRVIKNGWAGLCECAEGLTQFLGVHNARFATLPPLITLPAAVGSVAHVGGLPPLSMASSMSSLPAIVTYVATSGNVAVCVAAGAACAACVAGSIFAFNCSGEPTHVLANGRKEKFLFLVSQAESGWERYKNKMSKQMYSMIDRDEQLTWKGRRDAKALQTKMQQEKCQSYLTKSNDQRKFYENMLDTKESMPVYCSPMLRAVQTANIVFPSEAGYGQIVLLREARDVLENISDSLMTGLDSRVDFSDLEDMRWSSQPESEEHVQARVCRLAEQIFTRDDSPSAICVTHSRIIGALLMRYVTTSECTKTNVGEFSEHLDDEMDRLKSAATEKFQDCGVMGVRMVCEKGHWRAKEIHLMFESCFQGVPSRTSKSKQGG